MMTATRQDAWTEDDDLLLAETTLRHVREGSTQLAAFEEVGEKLGRTAAACGFRWNSTIRKKYEAALQIAKAQRHKKKQEERKKKRLQNKKEAGDRNELTRAEEEISFDAVIRFLKAQRNLHQRVKQLEKELEEKEKKLEEISKENEEMKKELDHMQNDYQTVNDDYKTLIKIMDRARKMTVLSEEEGEDGTRFKMDLNGNLERVDK